MPKSLYMVTERFKNSDPVPVYRRFLDRGRPRESLPCCKQMTARQLRVNRLPQTARLSRVRTRLSS